MKALITTIYQLAGYLLNRHFCAQMTQEETAALYNLRQAIRLNPNYGEAFRKETVVDPRIPQDVFVRYTWTEEPKEVVIGDR